MIFIDVSIIYLFVQPLWVFEWIDIHNNSCCEKELKPEHPINHERLSKRRLSKIEWTLEKTYIENISLVTTGTNPCGLLLGNLNILPSFWESVHLTYLARTNVIKPKCLGPSQEPLWCPRGVLGQAYRILLGYALRRSQSLSVRLTAYPGWYVLHLPHSHVSLRTKWCQESSRWPLGQDKSLYSLYCIRCCF